LIDQNGAPLYSLGGLEKILRSSTQPMLLLR
jgi:hypothetical protein